MEPFPSLADLSDAVRSGAEPAERWVSVALDRLEGPGRSLGAVLSLDRERSLAEAATVAARLLAGEQLPLAGVPVAIKDNICTADRPTTCGSRCRPIRTKRNPPCAGPSRWCGTSAAIRRRKRWPSP